MGLVTFATGSAPIRYRAVDLLAILGSSSALWHSNAYLNGYDETSCLSNPISRIIHVVFRLLLGSDLLPKKHENQATTGDFVISLYRWGLPDYR